MPRVSLYFFKTATIFLLVGVAVGLHMGITENHSAMPAHAHINLLGWVTSALFGGYYALQPHRAEWRIAFVHFVVYAVGMVIMLPALYLKYTGYPEFEPLLAGGSMIVGLGVLIFAYVLFSPDEQRAGR
jgi:peptidoglycan/LPS O-acetylase OafA/YrhL